MKIVLSISGGGIRGIIPAMVLAELEKLTQKPIADCFHLISGTSTGGIIACLLSTQDENHKSKYTAKEVVELYKQFGKTVFKRNTLRKAATLYGLIGTKYQTKPLEKLLHNYFGEAKLADTKTNLLIPAYQISNMPYPHFFKTHHACLLECEFDNPYLWECARATSAANGYFKPYKMDNEHTFLDGGVFANNPSMCAYAQAKNLYPYEQIVIISLGTGEDLIGYEYDAIKSWGMAQWALPFFKHTSISADEVVDYMLRVFSKNGDVYYRFQAQLDEESLRMDNASDDNVARLEMAAKKIITDNQTTLKDIAGLML